jgi:hypothetical protein
MQGRTKIRFTAAHTLPTERTKRESPFEGLQNDTMLKPRSSYSPQSAIIIGQLICSISVQSTIVATEFGLPFPVSFVRSKFLIKAAS